MNPKKNLVFAVALVACLAAQAQAPATPIPLQPVIAPAAEPVGQIILLKKSPQGAATAAAAAPATDAQKIAPRPKAQELPGVGVMPGDADDLKIKSVRVGTDRNELVYISRSQLNKISTPFDDPRIIDSTGATLKAVGQDLFIQPASDKPLTVYITNGGQGQSIGLTLVPSGRLPAQSIALQLDAPAGSPAIKAEVEEIVSSDYVSRITSLVKSLALDRTPAGFTRSRLPAAVIAGKELVIEPQQKYAGTTYDLYSYKVRSVSSSPLEMREEAFYNDAVRAVAFYPSALLQPGEDTFVFIIADRSAKDTK